MWNCCLSLWCCASCGTRTVQVVVLELPIDSVLECGIACCYCACFSAGNDSMVCFGAGCCIMQLQCSECSYAFTMFLCCHRKIAAVLGCGIACRYCTSLLVTIQIQWYVWFGMLYPAMFLCCNWKVVVVCLCSELYTGTSITNSSVATVMFVFWIVQLEDRCMCIRVLESTLN